MNKIEVNKENLLIALMYHDLIKLIKEVEGVLLEKRDLMFCFYFCGLSHLVSKDFLFEFHNWFELHNKIINKETNNFDHLEKIYFDAFVFLNILNNTYPSREKMLLKNCQNNGFFALMVVRVNGRKLSKLAKDKYEEIVGEKYL